MRKKSKLLIVVTLMFCIIGLMGCNKGDDSRGFTGEENFYITNKTGESFKSADFKTVVSMSNISFQDSLIEDGFEMRIKMPNAKDLKFDIILIDEKGNEKATLSDTKTFTDKPIKANLIKKGNEYKLEYKK